MESKLERITLIRHGDNEISPAIQNDRLKLSKLGINQAIKAYDILKKEDFDHVFVSKSLRTVETAKIICPNLEPCIDDRLIESGWANSNERDGDAILRAKDFINDIYSNQNYQNILVVSHGNLIKKVQNIIENRPNEHQQNIVDNCTIISYSKIDEETNEKTNYFRWKRVINDNDRTEDFVIPKGIKSVFIRHGESESNQNGILAGGMDFPLTSNGLEQATKIATEINNLNINFNKIYTSPLSRALKTSYIIAKECGIDDHKIIILDNLTGCGGGDLEGKPYSDWYAVPMEELVTKHGAESFFHQRRRIGKAILSIINQTDQEENPIIVSHSSVYQIIKSITENVKSEEEAYHLEKIETANFRELIL